MAQSAALQVERVPGFSLGPLTTYADPDAMAQWLAAAGAGEEMIYATGPVLGNHPAAVLVRRWIEQKLVIALPQRRSGRANCFEYGVRKAADGGDADGIAARVEPAAGKASLARVQMRELLAVLRDCAAKGIACPSHADAAQLLDLPRGARGRRRAQYLFDRLKAERKIAVTGCGRNAPRVVTILAPGKAQGKSTRGDA